MINLVFHKNASLGSEAFLFLENKQPKTCTVTSFVVLLQAREAYMSYFKPIHTTIALVLLLVTASCGNGRHAELKASKVDSLLFAIGDNKDYDYMLSMIDSLEETGDISSMTANRWRGTAYFHLNRLRPAEFYYKKVIEAPIRTEHDQLNYNKSVRRLASLLVLKGDYEGALRVAMPAVANLQATSDDAETDIGMLYNAIGCCQLNLGRLESADKNFNRAYQFFRKAAESDSTGRKMGNGFMAMESTIDEYIDAKMYEKSQLWIEHAEQLISNYASLPTANIAVVPEFQAQIDLRRAMALQGMGQEKDAAKAYRSALNTQFAKTPDGRLLATRYLLAAKRYKEAVDNFQDLYKLLSEGNFDISLDNIQHFLLPKFRANAGAQRLDSAVAIGLQMCDAIDSAIIYAKKDETAELATIFDTQQKDAEIVRQQTRLFRLGAIATLVALILVTTFFTVYTLHRRKAQHRLADAHAKLQSAYDQLEETTAQKERIESELRIARDIQMSMVPNTFPDREGIDLYAAMMPAKEVGGDLYGYLLEDNKLYFCIGDVSGKGVPASLFMAQVTRLFRILATQMMMPAEIATRMNAALAEDNEQGMFVTMFIGLVDLTTGRLDFCNCGHNPPIMVRSSEFLNVLSNAPIGLWPGLDFEGEHIDNIKDKPLLLYTDGLNEAEDQSQQQFGDDRLLELVSTTPFDNARHAVETLKAAVEKHRNGAIPNDDLTILGLLIS